MRHLLGGMGGGSTRRNMEGARQGTEGFEQKGAKGEGRWGFEAGWEFNAVAAGRGWAEVPYGGHGGTGWGHLQAQESAPSGLLPPLLPSVQILPPSVPCLAPSVFLRALRVESLLCHPAA
jgi:hypothetical protein